MLHLSSAINIVHSFIWLFFFDSYTPFCSRYFPIFRSCYRKSGWYWGPNSQTDSSLNDDESDVPHGPLLRSPGEHAEHRGNVFQKPSGIKISVHKNDIFKASLENIWARFARHSAVYGPDSARNNVEGGRSHFWYLASLSIDYESFSKLWGNTFIVNQYLLESRSLWPKTSLQKNSLAITMIRRISLKASISQLHVEAIHAFEDSENNLQSLYGEVSRVKDVLLQLEKQLSFCEAEALEGKTRVAEISEYVQVRIREKLGCCMWENGGSFETWTREGIDGRCSIRECKGSASAVKLWHFTIVVVQSSNPSYNARMSCVHTCKWM